MPARLLDILAKKTLFSLAVLLLPLWLGGCVSSYSDYHEQFSQVDVSRDFKQAMVVGADRYRYVFDLPDALSAVIRSPLRSGLHFQFSDGGTIAFNVADNGTISGQFYVILPDAYLQAHADLMPWVGRLGLVHGRLRHDVGTGRTTVIQDRQDKPAAAAASAAEASAPARASDGVYLLPVTITGRRFAGKDVPTLPDAYHYTMNDRHQVLVVDNQNGRVDLLGPVVVATGTGACIAVLPVCLAVALPMSGLRP